MSAPTFQHAGGFVVRTPLLPFAVLERLLAPMACPAFAAGVDGRSRSDGDALGAALEHDHRLLTDQLKHLLSEDAVIRDAIFLASPSLDERIESWLRGEDTDERAMVRSVLAYLARMTTRCTPFGLFAGCSTGTIVRGGSSLRVASHAHAQRHTRVDFGFLTGVIRELDEDAAMQATLTYRANSGLYRAGGRLRLAEARVEKGRVHYRRAAFDEDDALRAVLDAAGTGATLAQLAAVLADGDDDVTIDEAGEYLAELVDAQLLVSDLGPAITGDEPVPGLVERLATTDAGRSTADCLRDAQRAIDGIDAAGPGVPPSTYRSFADAMRKLDPDLDLSKLLQVDMIKPAPDLSLDEHLVDEVLRAVDVLAAVGPNAAANGELARFREEFVRRYEDREVALVEALDEEIGVGFAVGSSPETPGREASETRQLRLLARALSSGTTTVALDDDDLAALTTTKTAAAPDAIAVTCTIVASSNAAVEAGEFKLLVHGASGPSGARVLGRFCHADARLDALVRRHIEDEERCRPDAVFAEVVHLAEGRLGNVLARPVLRSHEIEFHGHSGAPDDARLAIDDLLVSVVGERIVLRSKRLGREVVPRLTSAHNYHNSALAPYRFLCSLQHQGVAAGLMWSWGALEQAAFLPRVEYGRLVLSRARWIATRDDLRGVVDAKTVAERFVAVQDLRERLDIPRWVAVAVGDNELTVDLATAAGCDAFAHEARQRGMVRAFELFPGGDDLCVESPDGRLFHELVVPLTRRPAPRPQSPAPSPAGGKPTLALRRSDAALDESFLPGSEWLTVKLYTGKATADAILRDTLSPLVAAIQRDGLADRWFFLRYGDPDWHLRLRFHGAPAVIAADVVPLLRRAVQPLVQNGSIWRVQFDTYRREVDRYGGPEGALLAEQVFHADSEAVLAALTGLPSDDDEDVRWQLAVLGVDRLLDDLGMTVGERRVAVQRWRDALATEHGAQGKSARQHAGQVMRRERARLTALLDGSLAPGPLTDASDAFGRRSVALAPVADRLAQLEHDGSLWWDVATIASSFCHMHVNRLLRASQRLQELLVYDLLDRLYNTRLHQGASA